MRKNLSIAAFILCLFYLYSCTNEQPVMQVYQSQKYHVKLQRNDGKTYDTIVPIEFFDSEKNSDYNIQLFMGFNYPKLNVIEKNNEVVLFNDSIEFIIQREDVDTVKLRKLIALDSNKYTSSPFFSNTLFHNGQPDYLPTKEISNIAFKINNKTIQFSKENYQFFYDPTFESWEYESVKISPLNGYVTTNGQIILTIDAYIGAGSYIAIFVFDKDGILIKKLLESIL